MPCRWWAGNTATGPSAYQSVVPSEMVSDHHQGRQPAVLVEALRFDDLLHQAQLITQERDGNLISLRDGVGTDQVVRLLVERGMSVYEITPVEETLEDFYLSLMNGGNGFK